MRFETRGPSRARLGHCFGHGSFAFPAEAHLRCTRCASIAGANRRGTPEPVRNVSIGKHSATSLDLYRELSRHAGLVQYFASTISLRRHLLELETERATAQQPVPAPGMVTLDVLGCKVVVDEAAVETEVHMDDWMEMGVFGEAGRTYRSTASAPESNGYGNGAAEARPRGIDPRHLLMTGERTTISRR